LERNQKETLCLKNKERIRKRSEATIIGIENKNEE